jgi:ABC-type glycerol-3-phosphate transport system substrate-binding protein
MATATDRYNRDLRDANAGYQIQVDMAPAEYNTKVAQMVADNELIWDGHMRSTNLGHVVKQYELGILQPWDEYINASSLPFATSYWDEVLPNVRESLTIDGKLYGLPWDGEIFTRVYNKMIWDLIGETPAETIDEFEKQMDELLVAAPDKIPMCMAHNADTPDAHMLMQIWQDDPWVTDEKGHSYLDIHSEAYANFLTMMKRWMDKGIITPDNWSRTTWNQSWNLGNTATGMTGAAWLQATAQKVWGRNNIIPMRNPVLKAGDQAKTLWFVNCAILFKGAAEPQKVTDWLLWMVDPTVEKVNNYSFIKGHLNYYHVPVYQSIYDNIISTQDDWKWLEVVHDQLKASAIIPPSPTISIVGPIVAAWEDKYVQGSVSYDECITGMEEEYTAAVDQALNQ